MNRYKTLAKDKNRHKTSLKGLELKGLKEEQLWPRKQANRWRIWII